MLGASGITPAVLTRPNVGLQPATPQNDAGRVIEPPVCEPIAPRHMPQATAAAEPLDEPPGVRSRFHGFHVAGGSKLANCVVTVLPKITAPASRSRSTIVASTLATLFSSNFLGRFPAEERAPASQQFLERSLIPAAGASQAFKKAC